MKYINSTLVLISGLLCATSAYAAPIDAVLVAETLTGNPLDTLFFLGTLTNTSGTTLFVNGATLGLAGFGPSDSDVIPFILNASGPLSANGSIGPVEFFTVKVPDMFPSGSYPGILTIQGGSGESDDSVLAQVPFHVNVASVPEPNSLALMICGAAVGLMYYKALLFCRFPHRCGRSDIWKRKT